MMPDQDLCIPVRWPRGPHGVATDSCRVLGQPGAEQLTGAGDALVLPVTASRPVRIQSAFVTDAEISTAVGDAARTWAQPRAPGTAAAPSARAEVAEYQALVAAAAELVISTQFGSVAMLQRRLSISFDVAARVMGVLESQGIVGAATGSRARDVLMRP